MTNSLGIANMVIRQLEVVPSWYFLRYSSQLMGHLGKIDLTDGEAAVVCKILNMIASDYPRALYYPFNATLECLGKRAHGMVQDIAAKLYDLSTEIFVKALEGLTHPHLR